MFSRTVLRSLFLFAILGCFACTIVLVARSQTAQNPQATPAQTPPPQSPQAPPAAVGIGPDQSPTPTPQEPPTFRVTAREVLLDVLVIDKSGQPVTGLKASDFGVMEEGEAQVIRRVSEHHAMDAADLSKLTSLPDLPPNTFSNYTPVRNSNASIVLLLDAMDSPIEAQMVMREQLIKFLKNMQPGPPVAIFQLDTEMRLIQGFTTDPRALLAAAESKRDMPSLAQPTAAPRNYSGDSLYRRTLMANLRDGMRMMGSYLSGYPGRKNLIWFTGRIPMTRLGFGFGNPFGDGMTVSDSEDESKELTDVLSVSRIAVYPVDTFGLVAEPGFSAARGGRPAMRGGIPGFTNHANMDEIAEQTGGKAYYNTNDFTRVIGDVARTSSNYYTVAYATTNAKWNGEFRKIKITVDRSDVQLLHKEGYYAYSLDKREQSGIAAIEKREAAEAEQQENGGTENGQPPAGSQDNGASANNDALGATVHHSSKGGFEGAMGLGAIPPTEIVFGARLQPDTNTEKLNKNAAMPPDNFLKPEWQHKPFRNYTILYDADLHRARFTRTPDGMRHGSFEFVAIVYTADGEAVNSIIETAELNVTADRYRELLVSGLQMKEEIAIPVKGNFFLRLGVHDKEGDQVGALEIPVDQIRLDVATGNSTTQ
jgi:VWFA-related protein